MRDIYLDMDGTLANFYKEENCLEMMYQEGFFRGLEPFPIVLAIQRLLLEYPEHLYILSACVGLNCKKEKRSWLREHLVDLLPDNIIFCEVGEDKSLFVESKSKSVLVDDYSKNLLEWSVAGGIALKARNAINCKRSMIAQTVDVMDSRQCYDVLKALIEG